MTALSLSVAPFKIVEAEAPASAVFAGFAGS